MGGVRILALDYGTKNVGLACCDEMGAVVRPLPSMPNLGRRDLLERIRALVLRERIGAVVIGMPWNMDGSAGAAFDRVERFRRELEHELLLPVRPVDERLSTEEALELWRAMTARRQRSYRTVDSLAAALILERHLAEA